MLGLVKMLQNNYISNTTVFRSNKNSYNKQVLINIAIITVNDKIIV